MQVEYRVPVRYLPGKYLCYCFVNWRACSLKKKVEVVEDPSGSFEREVVI